MSKVNERIVNLIITTKLNKKIDIRLLAKKLPNSIYEPEMFPGLVFRKLYPKSTLIMFSSGRITSIGNLTTKTGKNSINATAFEISQIMKEDVKPGKMKIVNVVMIKDLKQKIHLQKLKSDFNLKKYKKNFPRVILTLEKCKVIIFSTGKLISVGSKSVADAKKSLDFVDKMINNDLITKNL